MTLAEELAQLRVREPSGSVHSDDADRGQGAQESTNRSRRAASARRHLVCRSGSGSDGVAHTEDRSGVQELRETEATEQLPEPLVGVHGPEDTPGRRNATDDPPLDPREEMSPLRLGWVPPDRAGRLPSRSGPPISTEG